MSSETWRTAMRLLVLILLTSVTAQSSNILHALVSMQGMKGSIIFEQKQDNQVQAQFFFPGISKNLSWEIHEFPMNYDHSNQCEDSQLGKRLGNTSSGVIAFTAGPLTSPPTVVFNGQLLSSSSGPAPLSIAGRSIVLYDSSRKVKFCATIQPLTDVKMGEAVFTGCNSGRVIFRELAENYVTVFSKLQFSCGKNRAGQRLQVFRAAANYDGSTMACEDAAPQTHSVGTAVATQEFDSSEVNAASSFSVLIGDTVASLNGGVAMLIDSGDGAQSLRCATVRAVDKRIVRVYLNSKGVVGNMTFVQNSPFERTLVSYSVKGLRRSAGPFHIHQYPVPERMSLEDQLCNADAVAGHWNPHSIDMSKSPANASGTEDQYEVGDLSGKYGSWAGNDSANAVEIVDWNLPLFGPNRIIGRSFVVHNVSNTALRWVCADVGFLETSITAVAYFQYPVIGQVVMTQSPDNPYAETTLFAQMSYSGNEATYDLRRLVVTTNKVGSDFDAEQPGRCSSTGQLWNPSNTNSSPDGCFMANSFGCPVGDMMTKGCTVHVGPAGSWQKVFCTDTFLPLTGSMSILGKSMTLYGKDNVTALACADIVREMPLVAAVSHWTGSHEVSGNITLHDTETAITQLRVHLDGLRADATSYAVHSRPIHYSLSGESGHGGSALNCLSFAGDLYDPILALSSLSMASSNAVTEDQFPIGDLSGKHGGLSGWATANLEILDSNLPLSGLHSVVGRSIVIRGMQDEPLACGDIQYSALAMGARAVQAIANFSNSPTAVAAGVTGYVRMTQAVHADGAATSTTIEVQLQYTAALQPATEKHNWHVHANPLGSDSASDPCRSAGPHYNPFHRQVDGTLYKTQCNQYSSATCELGDLSSKLGTSNINGEAQLFTDVYLPLLGPFSVVGRSIVFHKANEGGERFICADILPVDQPKRTLVFPSKTYNKSEVVQAIASLLDTEKYNIAVQPISGDMGHEKVKDGCSGVMVYFSGFHADHLEQRLSKELAALGRFAPGTCTDNYESKASSATSASGSRALVCLLLSGIMLVTHQTC